MGSFTRVLGRYVREAELLTLEAAVAKMSALPARVFGLAGRGRIAVGAWADIVVFDADTVADLATWEAPTLPSAGVERVLVNGAGASALPDTPRPGRSCAARSRRKHNDSIHRRLPMFRKTCAALALAAALPAAHAAFPERPITLIVPFPAGGPTDIVGRWRRPRPARSWASRSWWKTAPARPAPSAWPPPRCQARRLHRRPGHRQHARHRAAPVSQPGL